MKNAENTASHHFSAISGSADIKQDVLSSLPSVLPIGRAFHMNTSMGVIHHGVIIGRQWQGHECGTPTAEALSLESKPKKKKIDQHLLCRIGGWWRG